MSRDPTRDEEAIFYSALELTSPDARAAFVKEACGDDKELLDRVRALLTADGLEDGFLEDPSCILDLPPLNGGIEEGVGAVVGRYKLLERIGEGGMAVVYMARREQPIGRKVALKVIKLGMDTKQVIARFEAERQALAMMDHPHIAKVLDGGATDTGRPYFVMELVQGVSITKYCDQNRLSTKERLGLFIQVCQAVQHAHQKGVVHRDLKPSNIMVTTHDGEPVPKIIDFGIAKATQQKLTEKTLFTRYAQIIGTPAYMSPEQSELSDVDIDTRSDVYSLGVLLYELLTGTTPFSEEELRKAGYLEMQRVIREEEPTKPSTKLSTLGAALADVAQYRKAAPDALRRLIRGDLDWIVMKSLEKARSRRYDTASALALDIQRHLDSEPVLARAPKTMYCLQKYLSRHRSQAIVAATIVVLAGALVAAFSIWKLYQRELAKATSLRAEAKSLKDENTLYQAQASFYQGDATGALETVDSILESEHVGSEARFFCASIYLHLAQQCQSSGDQDNVVVNMERHVNTLDPLATTNEGNRAFKDMLVNLWRATPENLGPIVNSPSYDSDVSISVDGLSLYFTSNRPGGSGSYDIWVTTRESVQDPWGEPVNLGPIVNSPDWDHTAFISADGLTLFFSSNRPGGFGAVDIWFTTRTTVSDPWTTPENLGSTINSSAADAAVNISLDGLSLFFNSTRSGGYGGQDLYVSTRLMPSEPWGQPANLGPTVNSSAWDYTPALSADGRVLIFGSNRPGALGMDDLWLTTRETTVDPWGEPVNLGPTVNSSAGDGGATLSADGSTLYFSSRRPGGSGGADLWQVSLLPEASSFPKDGHTDSMQNLTGGHDGKEVMP